MNDKEFMNKVQIERDKIFPMDLQNGYSARLCTENECITFSRSFFAQVFGVAELTYFRPPEERFATVMQIYNHIQSIHHDHIIFYKDNQIIGWTYGECHDPSTYYMRNTGILPEHQDKGIYSNFLNQYLQYLKAIGYERVSSQHKPNNRKILALKLKAGFNILGIDYDERWGSLVRLVYFTHEDRNTFFDKLCR